MELADSTSRGSGGHVNSSYQPSDDNPKLQNSPGSTDHVSTNSTTEDSMLRDRWNTKFRIKNNLAREFLAECMGTFILMVFGNGAVAQTVLSKGGDGDYLTIYWGYGIGVAMGVYVASGVSGAHLNPAVSISMCALGRLPWKKLAIYVTGQFTGAFLSGPVVYGIYYDALNAFDGGHRSILGSNGTAGIFATYPKDYLTTTNGFFDQVFGTALLLCGVLAISDSRNNKPPSGMEPLLVGLLVFALGNSYGTNCGYAINPARDFGPRLFTCMAGWGVEVFTVCNNWAWVPIVGPIVGGLLGSFVYCIMIELHWPPLETRTRIDEKTAFHPDESSLIPPGTAISPETSKQSSF